MINIIAFLGPSAVGKSTLRDMLQLNRIVTYTTRQPRSGEIDGLDYHFTQREIILEMDLQELLLEFSEYNSNLYATSLNSFKDLISKNECATIIVDKNGAWKLKEVFSDRVMIIGVIASYEDCKSRMEARNEIDISQRLASFDDELASLNEISDIIINNSKSNWHRSHEILNVIRTGIATNNLHDFKNELKATL